MILFLRFLVTALLAVTSGLLYVTARDIFTTDDNKPPHLRRRADR